MITKTESTATISIFLFPSSPAIHHHLHYAHASSTIMGAMFIQASCRPSLIQFLPIRGQPLPPPWITANSGEKYTFCDCFLVLWRRWGVVGLWCLCCLQGRWLACESLVSLAFKRQYFGDVLLFCGSLCFWDILGPFNTVWIFVIGYLTCIFCFQHCVDIYIWIVCNILLREEYRFSCLRSAGE